MIVGVEGLNSSSRYDIHCENSHPSRLYSVFIFQFPCAFEFNEHFLITVLDHLTR